MLSASRELSITQNKLDKNAEKSKVVHIAGFSAFFVNCEIKFYFQHIDILGCVAYNIDEEVIPPSSKMSPVTVLTGR